MEKSCPNSKACVVPFRNRRKQLNLQKKVVAQASPLNEIKAVLMSSLASMEMRWSWVKILRFAVKSLWQESHVSGGAADSGERGERRAESADVERKKKQMCALHGAQGFRCCRWLLQPSAVYTCPRILKRLDREVLVWKRFKNIILRRITIAAREIKSPRMWLEKVLRGH